jgi:hypothetical protein
MNAQLMLSMLLMLAVSTAFVLFLAALFISADRSYANGAGALSACIASSENAIMRSALPYSEFRIIANG